MTELVERYVHQVGRYLMPNERAEIEAELRSQIQDQLDDRFEGSPSDAEVASVLAEFGDPRRMAASYNSERYLVGPDLYPMLIMVLRHGWLIIPAIVIFLNVFSALASAEPRPLPDLVIETLIAAVQAALMFSAVVVLIFALVQHSGAARREPAAFNPLDLPDMDDPHVVDRVEAAIGIALGVFVAFLLLYSLRVGGLALPFNLSDPSTAIPVPTLWLILMIGATFAMVSLKLLVLRRNRWSARLWLIDMLLDVFGAITLYFVVWTPILDRLIAANPTLAGAPVIGSLPEIIAVGMAVLTLVFRGSRLIKLWSYPSSDPSSVMARTDG